jgi:hypothetical protein
LRAAARSANSRSSERSSTAGSNSAARSASSTADCAASSDKQRLVERFDDRLQQPGASSDLRCRRATGWPAAAPPRTTRKHLARVVDLGGELLGPHHARARSGQFFLLARHAARAWKLLDAGAQVIGLARRGLDAGAVAGKFVLA